VPWLSKLEFYHTATQIQSATYAVLMVMMQYQSDGRERWLDAWVMPWLAQPLFSSRNRKKINFYSNYTKNKFQALIFAVITYVCSTPQCLH